MMSTALAVVFSAFTTIGSPVVVAQLAIKSVPMLAVLSNKSAARTVAAFFGLFIVLERTLRLRVE